MKIYRESALDEKKEKLDTIINLLTLAFCEAKVSSVCKTHCGNALVKLREFREQELG